MRNMTRESVIEKYLVAKVADFGGFTRKLTWIGRNGAPDRLVLLPGGWLAFVELKAPGKHPEPHQARELARLEFMGQRVRVIDSLLAVDMLIREWGP